jgi:hypothetical protein
MLRSLWGRVSNLQILILFLGVEVFLVTRSSRTYHAVSEWLSHFL